jgi:hypothetical protein
MTNYQSNLETTHAWAHSLSNEGKNGNNSLNFRNNIIYSYSTPMAEYVENSNTVLFNIEKYSVTTSAHQAIIKNSIPYSYDIIEVPFNSSGRSDSLSNAENHNQNFEAWENNLIHLYGKLKRAKSKKDEYLQQIEYIKTQIQKYYELFSAQIDKRTLSLNIKNILNNQFSSDDLKNIEAKREKTRNLKIKRDEARRKKEITKSISDFFIYKAHQVNTKKIYLRLSKSKKWVETSQKAKVPLKMAIKLFQLADRVKKSQQELNINSINQDQRKIHDFQLDKIDEKGNATVGCHFLEFVEMQRLYNEFLSGK